MQTTWHSWSFREKTLSLFWTAVACLFFLTGSLAQTSLAPSDVLRMVALVALPVSFALSPKTFFLPLSEAFRITRRPDLPMAIGMVVFMTCLGAAAVSRHFGL